MLNIFKEIFLYQPMIKLMLIDMWSCIVYIIQFLNWILFKKLNIIQNIQHHIINIALIMA